MQDRLAELRRQRALVVEHLGWLDREIAAAAPSGLSSTPAVQPNIAEQPATLAEASLAVVPPSQSSSSDAVPSPLPNLRPADIKQDVRRGCFLYFGLALLLVVLAGALLIGASQTYKAKPPPVPLVEVPEAP